MRFAGVFGKFNIKGYSRLYVPRIKLVCKFENLMQFFY